MDLLELAIGFCLVAMSAFLALYGPLGYPAGALVAVVILIPACMFIYLGASKGNRLRALMSGSRIEQADPGASHPKVAPSPQPAIKAESEPPPSESAKARREPAPQTSQTPATKVTYAPITNLVVHEVVEEDQTTFFQDIVKQSPGSPGHSEPSVNWVDGLAIMTIQFPRTNEIIADNLAGKIHFQSVVFTRVEYQSKVNVKVGSQELNVKLKKADKDPIFVSLAAFLKGFKSKSTASGLSEVNEPDSSPESSDSGYRFSLDTSRS